MQKRWEMVLWLSSMRILYTHTRHTYTLFRQRSSLMGSCYLIFFYFFFFYLTLSTKSLFIGISKNFFLLARLTHISLALLSRFSGISGCTQNLIKEIEWKVKFFTRIFTLTEANIYKQVINKGKVNFECQIKQKSAKKYP